MGFDVKNTKPPYVDPSYFDASMWRVSLFMSPVHTNYTIRDYKYVKVNPKAPGVTEWMLNPGVTSHCPPKMEYKFISKGSDTLPNPIAVCRRRSTADTYNFASFRLVHLE